MRLAQTDDIMTFSSAETISEAIICPECGNELIDKDLAVYRACPYCGHKFQDDCELQDFIDMHAIQEWTALESSFPLLVKIEEENQTR